MADAREHRLAGPGVIAVTKQYMINVGIKLDGIIVVLLSRLFPGHVYPNIRIEISEAANDVLCDILRKGSLDIAIADFKNNEEEFCKSYGISASG